jgi:ABC-type uncharacterized transport system ATPase subunit
MTQHQFGEPKSEMQHGITQQHQHKYYSKSDTVSEKMLFGNGSGLKKRDEKTKYKEQEKQDKMESESQRSGVSRSTNGRFEGST